MSLPSLVNLEIGGTVRDAPGPRGRGPTRPHEDHPVLLDHDSLRKVRDTTTPTAHRLVALYTWSFKGRNGVSHVSLRNFAGSSEREYNRIAAELMAHLRRKSGTGRSGVAPTPTHVLTLRMGLASHQHANQTEWFHHGTDWYAAETQALAILRDDGADASDPLPANRPWRLGDLHGTFEHGLTADKSSLELFGPGYWNDLKFGEVRDFEDGRGFGVRWGDHGYRALGTRVPLPENAMQLVPLLSAPQEQPVLMAGPRYDQARMQAREDWWKLIEWIFDWLFAKCPDNKPLGRVVDVHNNTVPHGGTVPAVVYLEVTAKTPKPFDSLTTALLREARQ